MGKPSNSYSDSYLKNLVTSDIEDSAFEDVNAINPNFPEPWKTKLVVIRAYILTCGENSSSKEDLFHSKISFYRDEWKTILKAASDAYNALATTTTKSYFMSIPIARS